ncbi:MAG: sodium:proton antiporter [Gammaproteobacteria bacterium]|nr:MAG: sodium:proton antiporter [Gammaproteobacteria bacterium]
MAELQEAIRGMYANNNKFLSLLVAASVAAFFYLLSVNHAQGTPWLWQSLLPTLTTVIIAIVSRRPFESMMAGCLAGLMMLEPTNIISSFADNLSSVMGDENIIWVVLVCGLMGGFIKLLEISGCLNGFTDWLKTKIKSRRQSMVATATLGIVVFIDDYLNCLAVSSSVKRLTDFYNVSREKVAYLIDSTAAPMCVIIPVSTWAVFFAGLLEENGVAESGKGMGLYVSAIPYMAYAWSALIITLLVAFGVLGDFGPMAKAEKRAREGHPIPPDFEGEELASTPKARLKLSSNRQLFNFFVPVILLISSTVYFEIDLLRGVLFTCAVTAFMFYVQGLLTLEEQTKAMFDGFYTMLYPLATVIGGFFLKEINDNLGMTEYVVTFITPFMSVVTYPAIVFFVMALVVFGTGSSWGVFTIAIPIVMPVAQELGVYMPLVVGALLSASSFGSHSCFFSDSSLLASQGAGCSPMAHAFTQFPYAFSGCILAIIGFLLMGYLLS